jgi:putative hydrolase of the HAD superfamily
MSGVEAVISDFGGVLTSPLVEAFASVQTELDYLPEEIGLAVRHAHERNGSHPLHELELGRITEGEFLGALESGLVAVTGRTIPLQGFAERYFAAMTPNEELIDYYRGLRERGVRLAILTNNVREWDARWRALVPVDDLFELVVDSAFVGMRKPDAGIYELTLERLGLPAPACVFIDDLEPNVAAARAIGLHGIHFRDTGQVIGELDALLGPPGD